MPNDVTLRRDWFAPNGVLYRASHSPQRIPDELAKALPKDAKWPKEGAKAPSPQAELKL